MNTCTSAAPARSRELGDPVFAEGFVPAFWNLGYAQIWLPEWWL